MSGPGQAKTSTTEQGIGSDTNKNLTDQSSREESYPPSDPSSAGPIQGPERPYGFSVTQEFLFVLIISVAQMLMLAGIAQGLAPARLIRQSFPNTTQGGLAWYSAAYGLTAGTFVLPSGRLGDWFGHRMIFIVGFLWLAVWSILAGLPEQVQRRAGGGTVYFCICRAMQGIGPSLLVPNGQAMLGRAYKPGPRKNIVMCLFGAAAPLGFVSGAILSTLMAEQASWIWAYHTMGIAGAVLALVSVSFLPHVPLTKRSRSESLWVQCDGLGILLGVGGLVLVNFAFNQAPLVGWNTPYTYFLLVIGAVLMADFVGNELVVQYPLVPLATMRSTTSFVLGCTAAGWGCFGIWIFYGFDFLEQVRRKSPLLASAYYAHGPVSGLIASLLTGVLFSRGVRPQWIMFAAMSAFLVGSLLFATAPVHQSYWLNIFFGILVMPFGMDMSNPAATILLSNSVTKEHQGIAASLVVTVVNYSISLALGIGGTVEVYAATSPEDLLGRFRAAQYFGLGLGVLGVVLAAAYLFSSYQQGLPHEKPMRFELGREAERTERYSHLKILAVSFRALRTFA